MSGKIMLQGTGTGVGKTVLTTALCYIFSKKGYSVAPFKPWNLTGKFYTFPDGKRIGLSLALQAWAAGTEPCVEMNPFLVSPREDGRGAMYVLGEERRSLQNWTEAGTWVRKQAAKYLTKRALERVDVVIKGCYEHLAGQHDLVIIEGAGNPLRTNVGYLDLTNMKAAAAIDSPVLMVADIDVGEAFSSLIETVGLPYHLVTFKASPGFASLIGTLELLEETERRRIRGIVLNRYRGSKGSLQPIVEFIEERARIPVLGVMPYVDLDLPEEDVSQNDEEPQIEETTPDIERLGQTVEENLDLARIKEIAFGK